MSRLFEALRQSENENQLTSTESAEEIIQQLTASPLESEARTVKPNPPSDGRLVNLTHEFSLAAEKFRVLATRLEHLRSVRQLKTLHIASSIGDEGKTLVAANLALALGKSNQRVLLIEGDFRKPKLASLLGIPASNGLCDWHRQPHTRLSSYVLHVQDLNLWFLTAGSSTHDGEVLHSPRLRECISELAASFDWVIIDSPPLVPIADAHVWARLADGTLLVVREGRTPRKALLEALESLDNPRLVGVVLNDASDSGGIHYQHYSINSDRDEKEVLKKAKGAAVDSSS